MLLVLNEWVFHDLLNDNGQAAFRLGTMPGGAENSRDDGETLLVEMGHGISPNSSRND